MKSILFLSLFFLCSLSSIAQHRSTSSWSQEALASEMERLYNGKWNSNCNCVAWRPDAYSNDINFTVFDQEYRLNNLLLVVFRPQKENEEEMGDNCHFCPVTVDMAVYTLENNRWKRSSFNKALKESGFYDDTNEFGLKSFYGSSYITETIYDSEANFGISEHYEAFYRINNGKLERYFGYYSKVESSCEDPTDEQFCLGNYETKLSVIGDNRIMLETKGEKPLVINGRRVMVNAAAIETYYIDPTTHKFIKE